MLSGWKGAAGLVESNGSVLLGFMTMFSGGATLWQNSANALPVYCHALAASCTACI